MKAVMLSLRPQWCEKIFNGSKTIEVRKSRPSIDMPFKVYVYCTKAKSYLYRNPNNGELFLYSYGGYRGGDYEDRYLTGKVIGSLVCDRIDEYTFSDYEARYRINDVDIAKTCLNHPELIAYGKGKPLYGWHITEPKLFDKPRELGEFKHKKEVTWALQENGRAISYFYKWQPITRAPQSWVYVEVENDT